MATEQNRHLVPHDNSWKVKRAYLAVTGPNVIRITNIGMQQQFEVPGFVVEKNRVSDSRKYP